MSSSRIKDENFYIWLANGISKGPKLAFKKILIQLRDNPDEFVTWLKRNFPNFRREYLSETGASQGWEFDDSPRDYVMRMKSDFSNQISRVDLIVPRQKWKQPKKSKFA